MQIRVHGFLLSIPCINMACASAVAYINAFKPCEAGNPALGHPANFKSLFLILFFTSLIKGIFPL